MFKNRHIEIKLAKTPKTEEVINEPLVTIEEIEQTATNLIKKVVIGTVVTVTATFVLSTISAIVINACDKEPKE